MKRNKQVTAYRKSLTGCELTGRPDFHVHHIDHNRNNNDPSNLFGLCFDKHTGAEGIHLIDEATWIEKNRLTRHTKWEKRYEKMRRKKEYYEESKKEK